MFNSCGETCFSQKNVYKRTEDGMPQPDEKTIYGEENTQLFGKKKSQALQFLNYVMLPVFWGMKGRIKIDFFVKGGTVNCDSYCQLL